MMAATQRVPAIAQAAQSGAPSLLSLREELDRERRDHGRLQQAIFEAAQIQRRLCAPRELDWGEYEIAGEIFPVRHLSGDFFKVMELGEVLAVAVGDIAGKGLTAGIWLTHLLSLLQRSAQNLVHPGLVMAEVNRALCEEQSEPPLTALFYGLIDPRTNELTYCNAGLPAPLLLRPGQGIEQLEVGGPMLGAIEKGTFDCGRLRMDSGDMLVAYSDGVTECRNSSEQEFETSRLAACARAAYGSCANPALFSMLGTVLDFAGSSAPGDDLTFLVVRRQAAQSAGAHLQELDLLAPRRKPALASRPKKASPRGRGPR